MKNKNSGHTQALNIVKSICFRSCNISAIPLIQEFADSGRKCAHKVLAEAFPDIVGSTLSHA